MRRRPRAGRLRCRLESRGTTIGTGVVTPSYAQSPTTVDSLGMTFSQQ